MGPSIGPVDIAIMLNVFDPRNLRPLGGVGWFDHPFTVTFSYCFIFPFILKRTCNKHKLIERYIWRHQWGLSVVQWWLKTCSTPSAVLCSASSFPLLGPISCLAFQAHAYRVSSSACHTLSSFAPAPPYPSCFLTPQVPSATELHVQNYIQGALATPGLALYGKTLDFELML